MDSGLLKSNIMEKKVITLIILVLSIILLLFVSVASAETETFHATYKYVMGDNDTKNDAKTLCFIGAKRRLLEQIGTFIISHTEVNNYQLTKDEIKSYSAAFLNVEVEHEKVETVGENSAIVMTLRTSVDKEEIKNNLNRIIKDASLKSEISGKNVKISELENKIQNLQNKLTTSNYEKSFQLREERKEIFEDLYIENENIKRTVAAWKARESSKYDVVNSNAKRIRTLLNSAQVGMTPLEVMAIIDELFGDEKDKFGDIVSGVPTKGKIETEMKLPHAKLGLSFIMDRLHFTFIYDGDLKILSLRYISYRRYDTHVYLKSNNTNILTDSEFLKGNTPKGLSDLTLGSRQEIYKYLWGTQPFKQ